MEEDQTTRTDAEEEARQESMQVADAAPANSGYVTGSELGCLGEVGGCLQAIAEVGSAIAETIAGFFGHFILR